jgi:hypothetical protein
MGKRAHETAQIVGGKKLSAKDFEVDYKTIKKPDVVFRVMTFDHIPLAPGRKKTLKNTADCAKWGKEFLKTWISP